MTQPMQKKAIHYFVVFKHPFMFNGVQYFEGVKYHFTAVYPVKAKDDLTIASLDYGQRFSNIYFELAAPIQIVGVELID